MATKISYDERNNVYSKSTSNTLQVEYPTKDNSETHKEFENSTPQDKLIHEHDFVKINMNDNLSFLECITCDALFCESCGRSLDRISIQNPLMHKFNCECDL
jgi:hypothetical protein